MTRSSLVLLTTLALAPAPAAWADVISGIVPAANRVALVDGKATVKFMVNGQGTEGECGLWVEYGDQSPPDTHITGRKAGSTLPKAFEHTFTRPGQFTVTASGRRVKTAAGCEGQASTVVTVVEAGRERGRGPAGDVISGIVPAADRVALVDGKATVKFMVNGQSNEGECGLWVEYGDQSPPDTHIVGKKAGSTLPKGFEHTFTRPGQFTVTASGRRVKTAAGCEGQASTVVTVAEAGRERGRGSGPATCPAGWALREGSFDRRTGAFTCVPAYPQQRIDCGPGLRYFERDGMLGCRHRGQGKRD